MASETISELLHIVFEFVVSGVLIVLATQSKSETAVQAFAVTGSVLFGLCATNLMLWIKEVHAGEADNENTKEDK